VDRAISAGYTGSDGRGDQLRPGYFYSANTFLQLLRFSHVRSSLFLIPQETGPGGSASGRGHTAGAAPQV
jgi:hypothetical protein